MSLARVRVILQRATYLFLSAIEQTNVVGFSNVVGQNIQEAVPADSEQRNLAPLPDTHIGGHEGKAVETRSGHDHLVGWIIVEVRA